MDPGLSFDTTLNILSQNEDFKSNLLYYYNVCPKCSASYLIKDTVCSQEGTHLVGDIPIFAYIFLCVCVCLSLFYQKKNNEDLKFSTRTPHRPFFKEQSTGHHSPSHSLCSCPPVFPVWALLGGTDALLGKK